MLFLIIKSHIMRVLEMYPLHPKQLLFNNEPCCMHALHETYVQENYPSFFFVIKRLFSKVHCSFSDNTSAAFDTVGRLNYPHDMQILN